VISALSVSVIPHLVHPRKAVDLPERVLPSASGIWGGCIRQVSNPPNSIGTAVQPQVVIKRTNGSRLSGGATQARHIATPCSGEQLLGVVIAARNNHEVCPSHAINQTVFVIDSP